MGGQEETRESRREGGRKGRGRKGKKEKPRAASFLCPKGQSFSGDFSELETRKHTSSAWLHL
jgi:hypothetical protein